MAVAKVRLRVAALAYQQMPNLTYGHATDLQSNNTPLGCSLQVNPHSANSLEHLNAEEITSWESLVAIRTLACLIAVARIENCSLLVTKNSK